ncbi:sensor histidine kinase [Wukongibacter sp. M2B1]|uniref:sensor histidine kinase n=1 Tax=Wukongibacter sp. M2B1 TaxID=3088895 RepID=UPI003D7AEAF6
MNGIKGRWIKNYVLIPIIVLLSVEIFFIYFVKDYYYDLIKANLTKRVEISATFYNKYLSDKDAFFEDSIRRLYNEFSMEDLVETQIVDNAGKVLYTSSGLEILERVNTNDYQQALNRKVGYYVGEYFNGEKVMIVSMPLYFQDRVSGVIRSITTLEKADDIVSKYIRISLLVSLIIMGIMIVLSNIFSKSIIKPISEISRVSKLYANGDFTERIDKKYNDEIGELTDSINYMASEISKIQDLKNDFISSISHELRTPLTAINGWSETLLTGKLSDKEELETGLKIIDRETKRLYGLVEELLDFSRIERHDLKLEVKDINLIELLDEVGKIFYKRSKIEGINIVLNNKIDKPHIKGDYNRLKQVLINVIDNGFKFNKNNGYIKIEVDGKGDYVRIFIEDSGVGINAEDIRKVKEKFYKGNSNINGSGLGLSISNEIVMLHGGSLDIESKINKGTRVIIKLKRKLN